MLYNYCTSIQSDHPVHYFTTILQASDLIVPPGSSIDAINRTCFLACPSRQSAELNTIIDKKLSSGRPRFIRREIVVADEAFEVFYRDVIECIRALYGDPEFAGLLVFAPERHYADADHTLRVYFDMHTGEWWWSTQKELEKQKPGATIVPIIISSDKTQLTLFGSKTAYPVYLTIGNLPKDIRRKPSRRGHILLAYIPSTRLQHIFNKAARRRALGKLFHACMAQILKPLRQAGIDGIELTSGDGAVRRGHPIFALYIGDYPEQLLVTCCKTGTCPKCAIAREDVGATTDPKRPLRDLDKVLEALEKASGSATELSQACRDAGIKPIPRPFWLDLPFVNIFVSVTPDILHQVYQGMVKHLVSWLKIAYPPEELDARCRRLPPNHHIRLFLKGITTLQRVTGKEHADICRVLLGLIVGLPLCGGLSPVRLVRAVRAILDFAYLARYPAHTTDTIRLLQEALERFHANKQIIVDLNIRTHFRLPKLHSWDHYPSSIKLFGTTDNYDTQYTERLHIDFAKDAYRATNHKDEFPQMTLWLERREKIQRHALYIAWRLERLARITKWPSVKALRFGAAAARYGATYLRDALLRFVIAYRDSTLSEAEVEQECSGLFFQFRAFPVFHKIKITLDDVQGFGVMDDPADVIHARPDRVDKHGRTVPGRFDTVLVNNGTGGLVGVEGYQVGQVRLIFRIPHSACADLFGPGTMPPDHLAYVEWFTAFTEPDPVNGMYKVTRSRDQHRRRRATIVEVRNIRRSCHLYPVCNGQYPRDWSSSTVLDDCDTFFLSQFSDQHMYMTLL
ncbi:hypothetical protein C8Q76DRAFT_772508 [Earliella scabrosa]|nr:hypothetical protein C8Q76DRAFT_772508 [Earliella scabrosa]